jgi:UPF0755 protein
MKKAIIFIVLIGIGVGGYIFGTPYYKLHFSTIQLTEDEKTLYIPTGSSLQDLGDLLAKEEILDAPDFLDYAGKLEFSEDKIEPGKYKITKGMKIKNLIYALKNGNQEIKDVRITFNNCKDLEDIAGKVGPYIEADSTQLITYIKDPKTMEKYGFRRETMGSLFLPDTYEVGEWDMTAEEFVSRMADEYKKFWNAERKEKAAALNLEQSEIATLASIIEAEQGINTQEWKTIAGLYLNRIRTGMLLQSDPTAKYCWGDELDGVQRLLFVHMEIDCPYNTYKYKGLPPGPIRIPSKKAMDAVLNADKHDYLYMCAKPDNSGLHNFAASYAQHLENARKFSAYMTSRGH